MHLLCQWEVVGAARYSHLLRINFLLLLFKCASKSITPNLEMYAFIVFLIEHDDGLQLKTVS